MRNDKVQEIKRVAKAKAQELVIRLFPTAESLNDIGEVRQTVTKQNEIVKGELSKITSVQVKQSENAMNKMTQLYKTTDHIGQNFENFNRISNESKALFSENYPLIKKLMISAINVQKTIATLKQITNINKEVQSIKAMLNDYHNFYEVHEKIVALEDMMNDVIIEMEKENKNYTTITEEYFSSVRELIETFTEVIFKNILADEGIALVAKDSPQLLVDIARIIENEEARDKQRTSKQLPLKQYKNRLFKVIENEIVMRVLIIIKPSENLKTMPRILEELTNMMIQQLDIAQIDIAPCFPDDYKINEFYISVINKQLSKYVDLQMSQLNETDYGNKLTLLYWMRVEYHLAINEFLLKDTAAIDFKKSIQALMDDYMIDCHSSLLEMCNAAVELDFKEQDQTLRSKTNYLYISSGVELFTMLNSRLDLLIKTKNTKRYDFAITLAKTNGLIIIAYSQLIMDNINKRFETIELEMIYAYANNVSQCKQFLDKYLSRVLGELPAEYHQMIYDSYAICYDSLDDLLTHCLSTLVKITMNDCDDAFKLLFTDQWNNALSGVSQSIKAFQNHSRLEKSSFTIIHERLLEALTNKYLDVLLSGNITIKKEYSFEEKVQIDLGELASNFSKHLKPEHIEEIILPITYISSLISDLFNIEKDVNTFAFTMDKFLLMYPQSWGAIAKIIERCDFLPTTLKKQLLEEITESFNKANQNEEPTKNHHPFLQYASKFCVSKKTKTQYHHRAVSIDEVTLFRNKSTSSKLNDVESISLDDLVGEKLNLKL